MITIELKQLVEQHLGAGLVLKEEVNLNQIPVWVIQTDKIAKLCQLLYQNEGTYFDFLSCITGLDNGKEVGTMEVIYQLYSIPYNKHLVLKVILDRNTEKPAQMPTIQTVSHIWRGANWHEREIFDLLGINFEGHPDMSRILLPADWEGYPLRKDYVPQQQYHGIYVAY